MSYVIKVGDRFKTRGGKDVRIICVDAKGPYPIIGLIDCNTFEDSHSWTVFGSSDDVASMSRNLILPHPKTKRIAPVIFKSHGYWFVVKDRWVAKDSCPPDSDYIWLEHISIEVPDDD